VQSPCVTPHDLTVHVAVPLPRGENALLRSTSSSTHQSRFWSDSSASANIRNIVVTWATSQLPIGWLNDEAKYNILLISLTLEVSHKVMSSSKEDAAALQ